MQTSGTSKTYPGIDLLRALACMLVLVYHVIEVSAWSALSNSGGAFILRHGWVGVDLFLTISGFVIALSAFNGVERQGLSFRSHFARRRLARIVPLYLLTGLIFVVLVHPELMLMEPSELLRHIGSHLLFVHNLTHYTHGTINSPNWSVGLEMQFYLVMMFMAAWLTRVNAVRLLVGALVLSAVWRFAAVLLLPPPVPHIIQFIYMTQLPGVIDAFVMGIVLALMVHRGNAFFVGILIPGWRNFGIWLALSAVILSLATQAYLNGGTIDVGVVVWRPLLSAGFVALVGAAISFPWAGLRLLAPIRYIGTISYGVYLWHMLVLVTLTASVPTLKQMPLLLYVVAATLALASFSWHLLEKPSLHRYGAARGALRPALTTPSEATPTSA